MPNALIVQAKCAQDTGGMVCGSVASSNKFWHKNKYIDSHSISSVGVTFLTAAQVEAKYLTADDKEETKEKKCCICLAQIKHGDAVEEHMGEIYHTSCLDADYKDIARGAI